MPLLNKVGRFQCRVTHADKWLGESNTGSEYIGIPVEVVEGDCAGQHITAYLYLTDKAFNNSLERLVEVFGFNGDLEALDEGRMTFAGMECSIETEIEPYTNPQTGETKSRCKVKWLNAPGGGNGIKALDNVKSKALIARMGGQAKAIAAAKLKELGRQPVVNKLQPAMANSTPADDDLPF